MRHIVILSMLIAFPVLVLGQSITGRAVDENLQPVAYATVSLLHVSDSTFIAGQTTGDDGRFSLQTTQPEAIVKISCIGYQTLYKTCSTGDAGDLRLLPASNELGEVAVTAQRQLIKNEIDRIAYDVQADEESKTLTAFDMLHKVPMVTIDGEENILVNGNRSFKVHKNGHYDPSMSKQPKEVLKSMPASMIKRIEVITEPGAREDAEGVNAILNIVMENSKSMKGITGTVNVIGNSKNSPSVNAYITAQTGKLIFSANYGQSHMSDKGTYNKTARELVYKNSGNTHQRQRESRNPGNVYYPSIDASYEIDSLNLISLSFGGYIVNVDANGNSTNRMLAPDRSQLYAYEESYDFPYYKNWQGSGRADYEHRTKRKNETITLSYLLSFNHYKSQEHYRLSNCVNTPFDYSGYLLGNNERFTEHTFQADWIRPFGKRHKLETGSKYIYRANNSRTGTFYEGNAADVDQPFEHTTQVFALYADYMYNHKKWSARAGMRYEYSRMAANYPDGSGRPFHSNLHDYVPQMSLKYKIDDRQSLKFSFTTTINRPGIGYLNPTVIATTERISYGNAELKSSHSYQTQLNYMLITPKLTLNIVPSFAWGNNLIAEMSFVQGNTIYSTYANINIRRKFGTTVYAQWKPFKTTSIVGNMRMNQIYLKNPSYQLKTDFTSINYYASLKQKTVWNIQLTASLFGQAGKEPNGVYGYNGPWFRYSFALQRSFLKEDRLTLRMSTFMPFTKHSKYSMYYINGDNTGFSRQQMNARNFTISLSYRFGSLNTKVKKAVTTIQNDDIVGGGKK